MSFSACPWAGTVKVVVLRSLIRWGWPFETTISSTGRFAGIVTVGGVTEPLAAIVNRAGTRTLIEPVGVLEVVFVVDVVALVVEVVVVRVAVVCPVVGVAGTVTGVVDVDEVDVDFEPPQPATASAAKRTASPLTFAG